MLTFWISPVTLMNMNRNICYLLICVGITAICFQAAAEEQTYAERLGWPKGSKVVIFHIDDAGMSHDSNVGVIEAIENGVATSFSIMFPCPKADEIVQYVKDHPQADAGVHLTLTSEWKTYRWGPVADAKKVPGLIDKEGYLWHNVLQVAKHADPKEIETEMRAQVERCRTMGVEPTHLDTHMGTVFASLAFLEKYVTLGIETGIPVMVPAGHMQQLTASAPMMAMPMRGLGKYYGERLWAAGLPVLDDLHTGDLRDKSLTVQEQLIQFLRTMKPGVTQYIVHCTRPSPDFKNITGSGPKRLAECVPRLFPGGIL